MQQRCKLAITLLALSLGAGGARADDAALQASYDKMCASCHGKDGRGSPARAALLKVEPRLLDLGRDEAKAIPAAEKKRILLEGKARMPGYARKLAAADVDPMLAYCVKIVAASAPPPPVAAAPKPAVAPAPVAVATSASRKRPRRRGRSAARAATRPTAAARPSRRRP